MVAPASVQRLAKPVGGDGSGADQSSRASADLACTLRVEHHTGVVVRPSEPDFCLLSDVRVRVGGADVDCGPAKQRAVLAVLLLEAPNQVTIAEIAERVWGDAGVPASRIHVYIAQLRAALKPVGVALVHGAAGYRIDIDPQRIDVHQFRQLLRAATAHPAEAVVLVEQALSRWRTTPFTWTDSRWLRAYGQRLADEWFSAVLRRNAAWLQAGRHEELVDLLQPLVAQQPLDERLIEHYLLALYRTGYVGRALRAYLDFYRQVGAVEGRQPSPALRALHLTMLRQDAEPEPDDVLARPPRPSMLPAPVGLLVGRDTELAELRRMTASRSPGPRPVGVVAIYGPPGVGKTALALAWAHKVRAQFPGGALHADLGGFGPSGPAGTGQILDNFLTALGVRPANIPYDLASKLALYRTLIDGQKMLVLLDNAADEEQVGQLMATEPGSLVLVTSRRVMTGLTVRLRARPLVLKPLLQDLSVDLLRQFVDDARADREPELLRAITDHCGHLPLAVCLVGARLAVDSRMSITDLARELRGASDRLEAIDGGGETQGVRAAFSWSYHALDTLHAKVFRMLGLSPFGQIDAPAAAAMSRVGVHEAEQVLDMLTEVNLLQCATDRRYAMHDLIKRFAAQLAEQIDDPVQRQAAVGRLLDHNLATAARAMDAILAGERGRRPRVPRATTEPEIDDDISALSWLDRERTNLIASAALAPAWPRPSYLVDLAEVLFRYLDHGGYLADAVALYESATRVAVGLGEPAREAQCLIMFGAVLTRLASYERAADCFERSRTIFAELNDDHGTARALGSLGRVSWRLGRYQQAVDYQHRALELFRTVAAAGGSPDAVRDARLAEVRTLTNLGTLHESMDQLDDAQDDYQRALHLCGQPPLSEVPVEDAMARLWGGMAMVHLRRGEYQQASILFDRALDVFRRAQDRVGQAATLNNLGILEQRLGRYPSAVARHEEARRLLYEVGSLALEVEVLNDLGVARSRMGRTDLALSNHSEALHLAEQAGDLRETARAHLGLAIVHSATTSSEALARMYWHAAAAHAAFEALGLPDPEELRVLIDDPSQRASAE